MRKSLKKKIESLVNIHVLALEEKIYQNLENFILNETKNRKRLSSSFIIDNLASFLKKDADVLRKELTPKRQRREETDYSSKPFTKRRSGSLLPLLARKESGIPKYAVTEPKESNSSLVQQVRLESDKKILVRSSSQLTIAENGKTARGPFNSPYTLKVKGSSGSLWKEEKCSDEIKFGELPSKAYLEKNYPELFEKPSRFEFIVTKEVIEKRYQTKRPCSQKQLTGYSAKDFFKALGAEIREKTYGSFYHLAHRQGYGLGAPPRSKENLDSATEGSNYDLLFRVENPLVDLLMKDRLKVDGIPKVDSVTVKGEVIYLPNLPLPQEIIYTLSWGNARTYTTSIYPLKYDKPTIHDNEVSKAFMKAQRSPFRICKKFETGFFPSNASLKIAPAHEEINDLDFPKI